MGSQPVSREELKAYWDAIAPDRARFRARARYFHRRQERMFRSLIPEGSSVLELGCGTGELLAAVRPARGVGIDFSEKMIGIAQAKHPDLEFRVMDAEELALDEKFDVVILDDLVNHLSDVQKCFEGLRRVSHARTRILITFYSAVWQPAVKLAEWLRLKLPARQPNWLTFGDIDGLLALADCEAVRWQRNVLFPYWLPLLSEFLNRFVVKLPLLRHLAMQGLVVARVKEGVDRDAATSVVIPCRNERGSIEDAVRRTPVMGRATELIFVDGASTDGTPEEIERVMREHPEREITLLRQGDALGKGDAVRKGFEAARYPVLMILDADLTVPPEGLPRFRDALVAGKGEFINGSRLVYPMEKQAMRFLNLLANRIFGLLFTWLLEQRVRDTLCGTKALLRADYQRIARGRAYFGDFDPFGDFDLLFGAAKLNLKIVEIPVRYRERTYGVTNISRFRHGWLLLGMCWKAFRRLKLV
ncbi:MAG: glycosyltransferase [Planctomycetota bacterium]